MSRPRLCDWLPLALQTASAAAFYLAWSGLPAEVPVYFDPTGAAGPIGPKGLLAAIPLAAVALDGGFLLVIRYLATTQPSNRVGLAVGRWLLGLVLSWLVWLGYLVASGAVTALPASAMMGLVGLLLCAGVALWFGRHRSRR